MSCVPVLLGTAQARLQPNLHRRARDAMPRKEVSDASKGSAYR